MSMPPDRKIINRAAEGKRRRKAIRRAKKRRSANRSVIVQLVSAADVARLEARDEALSADITSIRKDLAKHNEVNREDNYEFMVKLRELQNQIK